MCAISQGEGSRGHLLGSLLAIKCRDWLKNVVVNVVIKLETAVEVARLVEQLIVSFVV